MAYGNLLGITGHYDQHSLMNSNPSQNMSGSMYGQNAMTFSQQAQQQYNQALAAQHHASISQLGKWRDTAPKWMFDGQVLTVEDFGKRVFGEDTPELTIFLLKYKDVDTNKKD